MKRNWRPARLALLAALVLMLTLPAGCAGESGAGQPSDGAAVSGEQEPTPALSGDSAEETGETAEPESAGAESAAPEEPTQETAEPEETAQEAVQPEEIAQSEPPQETAAQENTKPAETTPAAPEATAPAAPEETAPASLKDGTYTVAVTLSGGSGKAKVASPAALRVENGVVWATITWSSSNYDYMKVNGEKYLPLTMEGGSVFEIPVAGFDCDLPVVADTTAMSTPHEIEYTLHFDSATIQSAP
ncbi:MAG: hypothetical protein ACI3XJ_11960 [Oscillospiraceae bacterium]